MKVDVRRSIQVFNQLVALGKWNRFVCWDNAIYAVLNMMSGEVMYVEGFVEVNGKVIWHSWIEDDGKIIEPTNAPALSDNPKYRPVSKWSRSMLRHELSQIEGPTISLPITRLEDIGMEELEPWLMEETA